MGFIVEVVSRSGRVLERHRFDRSAASIGRAYDSDIILSDPYAAAQHVRILSDFEGLGCEVVSDDAPTLIDGDRSVVGRKPLQSGAELTLGRSHLRVFSLDHPVPPPLPFQGLNRFFARLGEPIWVAALFGLLVVLSLWEHFFVNYGEVDYSSAVLGFLSGLAMVSLWAGLWALLTRVSRHETRFFQHWGVAVLAIGVSTIYFALVQVISFNTGDPQLITVINYIGAAIGVGVLLVLHLRIAFAMRPQIRHLIGHGLAWSVVGYSALTTASFDDIFHYYPEYEATVLSDSLLFVQPSTEAEVLERFADMFDVPVEDEL